MKSVNMSVEYVLNHRTPSDTAELFARMVLEMLMLSTFNVGVNPICSVFFWVFFQ